SALNRRRPWSLAEPVVGRAVPMVISPSRVLPLSRVHAESGKRLWMRPRGGRLSPMPNSPRAGQPAQPEDLVDVDALLASYHDRHPDPSIHAERVAFGTSGHRGSSLSTTFNDDHIAATSQAIVEYRASQGT